MKVDKDALIKHRFWILAVLSVPLALVAIFLLLTSVSAGIGEKQKQHQTKLDEVLKVPGGIPSPDDIEAVKKKADEIAGLESVVWGKAAKAQLDVQRWPAAIEKRFQFADGLFANDIQVLPLPENVEGWPQDKEGALLHGTLSELLDDYLKIKDRDGNEVRFNRTAGIKINLGEEGKGAGTFNRLDQARGKLLAVGYQQGKYFDDKLTDSEQLVYKDSYHTQIHPILEQVRPVNEKGEGEVQFKNWAFKKDVFPPRGSPFLRYVYDNWDVKNDISSEAWIAQEDLWIQNEIYRLVRAANESVGQFVLKGSDPKTGVQHYQNPYFDLELKLKDKETLDVKIANRLPRRQKLDLKLKVQFNKDAKVLGPEEVMIPGTPLGPRGGENDKRALTVSLGRGVPRQGIFGVEQVLTWETTAVKRVDLVTIGSVSGNEISHSHRTFVNPLRAYKEEPKEDAAAGGVGGVDGGPMGLAPPGGGFGPPQGLPPGGPGGAGGFGGGAGQNQKPTPNGLWTNRYVEVTPQARRIPVGIVLIVDQDHVDRVQTAFNNSKLRFLMTQVLLNHYPGSLRPVTANAKGPAADGMFPPGFVPYGSPPMGSVGPPPGFDGEGGMPPGGDMYPGMPGMDAGQGGPSQDLEANMELVMYGYMTLYERYPPRPGGETEPAAAAAPAE